MMKLRLPQLNKSFVLNKGENLFAFLRDRQIPVASSCKGEGICGKCVMQVSSSQPLSPPTEQESKMATRLHFASDKRLICQCQVADEGDIELHTTYW